MSLTKREYGVKKKIQSEQNANGPHLGGMIPSLRCKKSLQGGHVPLVKIAEPEQSKTYYFGRVSMKIRQGD